MLTVEIPNSAILSRREEGTDSDLFCFVLLNYASRVNLFGKTTKVYSLCIVHFCFPPLCFQINANDSLWPWSCNQTVGDFKTGKSWLIAERGKGGTDATLSPETCHAKGPDLQSIYNSVAAFTKHTDFFLLAMVYYPILLFACLLIALNDVEASEEYLIP